MTNKEIIELWKQGYSVKQITNKSKIVQRCKNEIVTNAFMYMTEYVILKYQSRNEETKK